MTDFLPAGIDAVLVALAGALSLAFLRGAWTRWIGPTATLLCLLALLGTGFSGGAGPEGAALPLALIASIIALGGMVSRMELGSESAWRAASLAGVVLALLANNAWLTWLGAFGAAAAIAAEDGEEAPALPAMLALLGTVLLALAARPVLGPGLLALRWSDLLTTASRSNGKLLGLGFVFLLIGYGALAGLVPLALRQPRRMPSLLAASLGNAGLLVLLRLRRMLAVNPAAIGADWPLLALGLLSVLAAAFALWRREDARRMLRWAGTGQAGVIAVAFGLGGVLPGLLQMVLRALSEAAAIHALGDAHPAGTAGRGRLTAAAGLLGLAAVPPSGLFAGFFLILSGALARAPLLTLPLTVAIAAMSLALVAAARDATGRSGALARWLVWLHLGLAAVIGYALPGPFGAWLGPG